VTIFLNLTRVETPKIVTRVTPSLLHTTYAEMLLEVFGKPIEQVDTQS